MRIPIMLDDELVTELDRRAGAGRRSAFAAESLGRDLEDERRWGGIESALAVCPIPGTSGMAIPARGCGGSGAAAPIALADA